MKVAEPVTGLGVDPVATRGDGLAQVADTPQRCALLGGEREEEKDDRSNGVSKAIAY